MAAKTKKTTKKEEAPKRPKKLIVEEVVEETVEKVSDEEKVKKEAPEKETPTKKEKVSDEEKVKEKVSKEVTEGEGAKEEETPKKEEDVSAKKVLFIAIPIAIFTGLLSGGIFYYVNSNKGGNVADSTPTPAPIVEDTSTPEPVVELERSDLSIQVLNGSGISGKAGEVKDVLEELGYENVDAGNADSYDFEEMVISIKEESEDYVDMLVEDLSDDYTVADDTEELDEDSDFDVVITVGTG